MRQTYRQDEAEQILREAMERAARESAPLASGPGAVPHERLRAMAEELGIEPATLEAVLREREGREAAERERTLLAEHRREFLAHRRARFWPHLRTYLGVNALLILINLLTSPGYFWAIWPLLGWGIGIYFQARSALAAGGEEFETEFAAWRAERELGERP